MTRLAALLVAGFAFAQVPFWPTFQAVAGPRAVDRAAQVRQESGFKPSAVSPAGARGIAQFMPATWAQWGTGQDPFDPCAGINSQHRYMNYLEGRTGGDWAAALGAYNAGLGTVRKAQRLADQMGLPGQRAWIQAQYSIPGRRKAFSDETAGYIYRIETVHVPWVRQRVEAK